MCALFLLMTSALPAAASSRASKNAPTMRRSRQIGLDNTHNRIINARARATTIESAIGHSDVAHANTGNTEDISGNCISPPSRGGMVATCGANGRISHSVSSMATSQSSPRPILANYGEQITRSLSLWCCHVSGDTSCNRWPATARRPAATIRQRRNDIPTKALGASIQAFLLIFVRRFGIPRRSAQASHRATSNRSRVCPMPHPPPTKKKPLENWDFHAFVYPSNGHAGCIISADDISSVGQPRSANISSGIMTR